MIQYVKGDLFTTTDPVIAHGCNAQRVMGSGVARIVRETYPDVYEAYLAFIQNYHNYGSDPLGRINPVITAANPELTIINAITQNKFGGSGVRWVSYDAIDSCFNEIGLYMRMSGLANLSIPKIGAGLGGGDWDIIESIINAHTKDINVTVWTID